MGFNILQETGRPLTIKDEGITLNRNVSSIDFVGANISGSAIGAAITETSSEGQLDNIVEDTTPQLGGDLDLNGFDIVFPSLSITNVLDEDDMVSDSVVSLATQQSIKAYVDTQVATVDTWAEVLALGNTSGATDVLIDSGQKLGIGNATPVATIDMAGTMLISTTAAADNERGLKVAIDAAGFADLTGVEVDYVTGVTADGDSNAAFLVNVDDTAATGGYVHGFHMRTITGGASSYHALHVGAGIHPIHQDVGTFANPTTGTNNTASTDVADMIDGSDGTTTSILVNDNDYIIIGAAAVFEEMSVSMTTSASVNLKTTFWYSTAGSGQYTQFTPIDGTDGFKKTGLISWNDNQFVGHTTNDDTGTYDIKIIRTKNNATTTPIVGHIKTATIENYHWRSDGDIEVRNGDFAGYVTATGVITGLTIEPTGDTAAADLAAIGYTSVEGLILTGQGSTYDVTMKNDIDGTVLAIPTGTTDVYIPGKLGVGDITPDSLFSVAGTAATTTGDFSTYSTTNTQFPWLKLRKSASDVLGTLTATADGDYLGVLGFEGVGSASPSFDSSAYILGIQNGAVGTTRVPADLEFYTSPGGSTAPIKRFTVGTDGKMIFTAQATIAHMNLAVDSTNSSPTEGDIWRESDSLRYYDGTDQINLLETYKDFWIDAGAFVPRVTNGAAAATEEYATNDIMSDHLLFDGATEEGAQVKLMMPDDWDLSTFKVKVFWDAAVGASAADTVEWSVSAGSLANDDAIDTALGTKIVINDAVLAVGDNHVSPASGAITSAGTPALGELTVIEIVRSVAGTDDMTEDAKLLGIAVQYKKKTAIVAVW